MVHRYELANLDPNELVTPRIMQDLICVYLKKLNKPVKIHVNGAMDLYTRCVRALLEENVDVNIIQKEWFNMQPKLVILGCGHVSQYLAKMASILELYTIVIDNRKELRIGNVFQPQMKFIVSIMIKWILYCQMKRMLVM